MLTAHEEALLYALYDSNRIPLWQLNDRFEVLNCFVPGLPDALKAALTVHVGQICGISVNPRFDILSVEHELYSLFAYERMNRTCYILGGPMLLSYANPRHLSCCAQLPLEEAETLAELLPVVTLASFSSCLRVVMLLLRHDAPALHEISGFKLAGLDNSLQRTFVYELFDNREESRAHTPYSHEVAVLNCVRDGDASRLEAAYRTLPQTQYGNMSSHPLRQLLYGCIANTTLVTRYAIEGGLEEEMAFTLSDVYIKRMELCRTAYELCLLNEKMALDFTAHVARARLSRRRTYSKTVSTCIDYIFMNIHHKITLAALAKEMNLTPKYLSFLFHKETGQTLTAYIEDKKISEAKRLLAYSKYSYNQICHTLSFSSHSYFISVFKKHEGMTPRAYRENMRTGADA